MVQVKVHYEGHVQGVGFRFTTVQIAKGFEVSGTVSNLPEGQVELIAQGEQSEVQDFLQAITDSSLKGNIRSQSVTWGNPDNTLLGFRIQ